MYEAYYQLQAKPFTLLPDPGFLFLGTRHKMALSLLEYGVVNRAAFIVITGEPGTGKTTLLNRLLEQPGGQWTIGVLSNTHGGLGGLMPWIAAAFGLEVGGKSPVELFHRFERYLEREQTAGRRVFLVLDEAQNLGSAMLEELRLLSNLNDGRRCSLQILLSGQPALRGILEQPAMEQFAQRIAVEYALQPLGEDEVAAYIDHRIRVAGAPRSLFSTLACRMIFILTGGIPRLINQLCDHALVYGYAAQATTITASVVLGAARERARQGCLPFRAAPDGVEPTPQEREAEAAEAMKFLPVSRAHPTQTDAKPAYVDPSTLYREGLALRQAGEFMRAAGLFEHIAGNSVLGAKALAQKGLCLKSIGRYDEALATFRRALELPATGAQDVVSLRYLCARTLEAMGNSEAALEIYQHLRSHGPQYRDVATRMDRLAHVRSNGARRKAPATTTVGSILQSCSEWLRDLHPRRFISLK